MEKNGGSRLLQMKVRVETFIHTQLTIISVIPVGKNLTHQPSTEQISRQTFGRLCTLVLLPTTYLLTYINLSPKTYQAKLQYNPSSHKGLNGQTKLCSSKVLRWSS